MGKTLYVINITLYIGKKHGKESKLKNDKMLIIDKYSLKISVSFYTSKLALKMNL